MNDLVKRLRQSVEDVECGNGGWATPTSDLMERAADHIEAQSKLIEEMREMLERARNCVLNEGYYSFSDEIQDVISKSNPNTPERNEE